jgi:hypothetical protein
MSSYYDDVYLAGNFENYSCYPDAQIESPQEMSYEDLISALGSLADASEDPRNSRVARVQAEMAYREICAELDRRSHLA